MEVVEDREAVLVLTMMVVGLSWKADNSWGGLSGADKERTELEVTLNTAVSPVQNSAALGFGLAIFQSKLGVKVKL